MATIKDVAKEAGVAVGTVSKYINNTPIGDEYKKKIAAAIKKLDYQVNTYARGLKTKNTYNVALILPDVRDQFFSSFAYYTEKELNKKHFKMFLCSAGDKEEREAEYINMAKQNKVDGIIAITYSDIEQYIDESIPFISVDRHFSKSIPCVTSDNYYGGRLAVKKLIECGCKNLLFLRTGSNIYGETNKRYNGFLDECNEQNISHEALIYDDSQVNFETAFSADAKKLIKSGKFKFDGIFSATDRIGYIAMKVLKQNKLSVPDDVQIIGFDGVRKFVHMDYYLSTIVQPVKAMAKKCVELLLEKDRTCIPSLTVLPVKYQFGGTTKE